MFSIINKLLGIPREIKWFIQRGVRGYSDKDCWNLDYYIADVLQSSCTTMRKRSNGFPVGTTEDEWDRILADISYGFWAYNNYGSGFDADFSNDEDYLEVDVFEAAEATRLRYLNRSLDLLKDYFPNLWD